MTHIQRPMEPRGTTRCGRQATAVVTDRQYALKPEPGLAPRYCKACASAAASARKTR